MTLPHDSPAGRRPQLRLEMGRAARQRLLEVGLWPGKTDRTIELYQELIGAHSQRVSR